MGISWHSKEYHDLSEALEDYIRTRPSLAGDEAEIHDVHNRLINIMIDHGAVDPT